jgi:hypothetical protein
MSSDQLRQIEELYRSVRECSPEARAALLGQADPELRRPFFLRTRRDTGPAAVSPDGQRLAFSARSVDGGPQLYVRSLETVVPQDGQVRVHDAKTGVLLAFGAK